MKNKNVMIFLFIVLISVFIIYLPANAEDANPMPLKGDPVFDKATFYNENSQWDRAIEEYRKVIDTYPGTELEATARFAIIDCYCRKGNLDESERHALLNEYQVIIDRFPDTRYSFVARLELISRGDPQDPQCYDAWLHGVDELILELGGKSIFKIIRKKRDEDDEDSEKGFHVSSVVPKYRNDLANLYMNIATDFISTFKDNKNGFRILRFVRESFPKFTWSCPLEHIKEYLIWKHRPIDWSKYKKDKFPPKIYSVHPRNNQRIGNRKPKIKVKLTDGDIAQMQVDLSKTEFKLDGKDITDKMTVKSHIKMTVKPGKIFEKIILEYRPDEKLSKGKHTIYIKAYDNGNRYLEKSWSFYVK
ncbi:MAG: hypothetical protein K8T10_02090 [Candidatus Eremiobacteraeota bacterium]|nr:hypothetical protein [Candidatus Eremiobacteraeota bacterium]